MPVVDPPPYPEGRASFGEQIDFHDFIRIWHRRMVRRWEFHGVDPHHLHHLNLMALPDGRFSVNATASREYRVWLFPTLAEAEAAAETLRGVLRWSGEWREMPVDV